ncbi:MAG: hypothetical protein INH41_01495 [Myxococcaceae bacterium]|jgi:hypothetical protein|nr:hypothetical protein [Myxococcaceae bacterium]
MLTSFILTLLLSQTPPPVLPVEPVPRPGPSLEAVRASPMEPVEVAAFARFVEQRLITIDFDQAANWGALKVRQRERVFSLRDDDFSEAFHLVPEAMLMAQRAQEAFRVASTLQIVGLSLSGAAVLVVGLGPILVGFSAWLPLLVVGLVASLVGLVVALVSVPFSNTANASFVSAVAGYNKGLLDLRPASASAEAGREAGGLTFALP